MDPGIGRICHVLPGPGEIETILPGICLSRVTAHMKTPLHHRTPMTG